MKRWLAILGLVDRRSGGRAAGSGHERDHSASVSRQVARARAPEARRGPEDRISSTTAARRSAAKVVSIFWGPSWIRAAAGRPARRLIGFFETSARPASGAPSRSTGSGATNLTNNDWIDSANPPHTAVTDSDVQAEVVKYINGHGGAPDASTVYEVFIPNGYYAKSGNSTSCGGPNLQFCAYHGHFCARRQDIKYASMPTRPAGAAGDRVHGRAEPRPLPCHETREAATDPDLNAWYDRRGNEADDKCAWSPAPFVDAGFGYQWEWSNADSGCVKTK